MKRLQRLRRTEHLRNMLSEIGFNVAQLIQPLFVVEGLQRNEPIPGLKGNERLTIETVCKQIQSDFESGVKNFILFIVPAKKESGGFGREFGHEVIAKIKGEFKNNINLWVDTCLCSFTTSRHCYVCDKNGDPNLEETLKELSQLAVTYSAAGADGVAPSDMNDGRVKVMRQALDESGYNLTPIISYSTKFASAFYGPFRLAADSAPQYGNRRHYQIDVRNRSDAIASSIRCAEEGADLLMVKPAMTSLDLISPIHSATGIPVGAYQVSGEYAGLAVLAERDLLNFEMGLAESWHVLRRAGARYIISYGARYAKECNI